jgi:hypothetical protein
VACRVDSFEKLADRTEETPVRANEIGFVLTELVQARETCRVGRRRQPAATNPLTHRDLAELFDPIDQAVIGAARHAIGIDARRQTGGTPNASREP